MAKINKLSQYLPPAWVYAVARDCLTLLLTGVGCWLAFRAVEMGREQGVIAKKQAEIADVQHKIFMEQKNLRADFITRLFPSMEPDPSKVVHRLSLTNTGQKEVGILELTLILDKEFADSVDLKLNYEFKRTETSVPLKMVLLKAIIQRPFIPGVGVDIGEFKYKAGDPRRETAKIRWGVACSDGTFPKSGTDGVIGYA